MKKKIGIAVLALIVVVAIVGYYLYTKKTPDVVNDNPDVSVTATNLITAFEKDSAAAARQYMDKLVAVSGRVKSVDTSGSVVLGEEGTQSVVVCGLDRRHLNDAAGLKPGATATLQGRCTGYTKGEEMMGISLGTTVQLAFAGIKSKQ